MHLTIYSTGIRQGPVFCPWVLGGTRSSGQGRTRLYTSELVGRLVVLQSLRLQFVISQPLLLQSLALKLKSRSKSEFVLQQILPRLSRRQFWIPFGGPYLNQNPNLAFSVPLFIGPCSCRAVMTFSGSQFRIHLGLYLAKNPIWPLESSKTLTTLLGS